MTARPKMSFDEWRKASAELLAERLPRDAGSEGCTPQRLPGQFDPNDPADREWMDAPFEPGEEEHIESRRYRTIGVDPAAVALRDAMVLGVDPAVRRVCNTCTPTDAPCPEEEPPPEPCPQWAPRAQDACPPGGTTVPPPWFTLRSDLEENNPRVAHWMRQARDRVAEMFNSPNAFIEEMFGSSERMTASEILARHVVIGPPNFGRSRFTQQVTGEDGIPRTETRSIYPRGTDLGLRRMTDAEQARLRPTLFGQPLESSRPPLPGEGEDVLMQVQRTSPGSSGRFLDVRRRLWEIVRHGVAQKVAREGRPYLERGQPWRMVVQRPMRFFNEADADILNTPIETLEFQFSGDIIECERNWRQNIDRLTEAELECLVGWSRDECQQLREAWGEQGPWRSGMSTRATQSQEESGRSWLMTMAEESATERSPEPTSSSGTQTSPPSRSPGRSTGSEPRS